MNFDTIQTPPTIQQQTNRHPPLRHSPTIWFSLKMLIFCLMITGVSWHFALTNAHSERAEYFGFRARDALSRIEQRMAAYSEVLRGVRGLYNATGSVQRPAFREYVAALKLGEQYPGIQGVGFSLWVPASEREKHVQSIRGEEFPSYAIRPDTPRDTYTSIIYLEPFSDRNLRAFGYDMYSEAVRRAAMEQARDSDIIAISGKVRLVQETNEKPQAGFLMYLPIYRADGPVVTTQQRRAAIIGWAYSPFRMDDLMAGIQGELANDLDIEIFDGTVQNDSTQMYDSDNNSSVKHPTRIVLQTLTSLNIAGHCWSVHIQARPDFYNRVNSRHPDVILMAGGIISLLMTMITWLLLSGRERAIATAQKMTRNFKASEERYRSLVMTAPITVAEVNRNGTILFINRCAEGFDPAQVIGSSSYDYLDKEGKVTYSRALEKVYTEMQTQQFVIKGVGDNGETRTYESFLAPVIIDGVVSSAVQLTVDITERTHLQDELKNLSREMNLILETAPVGISKIVGRTQVWINQKTETMFGYTREDLVDKTTEFLYPSHEQYEKMGQHAYPVLAEGLEYETIQELVQKNGNHIWVKYNGRAVDPADLSQGTIWALADITAQKQATEMLREKELLYHAMFERNSAVKLLINPESGAIVDANTSAAKFYGYSVEQLKAMTISEINTLPAESIREELDKAALEDRSFFNFRHRLANGTIRNVEVFSSPLNIHGRTLLHSIIHDVTEQRNAEMQVQKSLAEKEILLREIHHRVKNNMAVITSLLRLQGERIPDPTTRLLFTESEQRIKSMAIIHERLYQARDLGVIDIKDYFSTIIHDLVASYHREGCVITATTYGDELKVDIDTAIPCGLIINELITNALKYAFPGRATGAIEIHIDKQGDQCALKVQDNGIGFPNGFDLHTTGTLGLQLVEALCTQLRATLELTSATATGQGVTINIAFKVKTDRQQS